MKVFRFEHKKFQTGMFTTKSYLLTDAESAIQNRIQDMLMTKYNEDQKALPDPKNEYLSEIGHDGDLIELMQDNLKARAYQDLVDYIQAGAIFGCKSLEQAAQWVMNSKKLVGMMNKCGYFLYELELDTDGIYDLKSQVIFKRENIKSSKVVHTKTILGDFLK